jgi:alpha-tubulin suppressor-like RCC1 family protein
MSDRFADPIEVLLPDQVAAATCGNQHTVVLTRHGDVFTCGTK